MGLQLVKDVPIRRVEGYKEWTEVSTSRCTLRHDGMESWKSPAAAGIPAPAMVAATPCVSASPAADYLDRCGALAAAAAAGLSGMMLAVTSPPRLAALSSC